MEPKQLQLKGIQRNYPQGSETGAPCDEMVNMRFTKNAWRPVGQKEVLNANINKDSYLLYYIHRLGESENWLGWDGQELLIFRNSTGYIPPQAVIAVDNLLRIVSLKRFLILVLTDEVKVLLWGDDVYSVVDMGAISSVFAVGLLPESPLVKTTDTTDTVKTPEALLGKYYKLINEESKESRFNGAVAYRYALRLFDGSYILHSVPKIHHICDHEIDIHKLSPSGNYAMTIETASVVAALYKTFVQIDFDLLKKLVSSVDLFFSPVTSFFQVDEDSINEELLASVPSNGFVRASAKLDVDKKFREIPDQIAWYKVGSADVEKLRDAAYVYFEMDLENYYKNYATKRILPVDNFSHHQVSGLAPLVYNGRLWLGNTTQRLSDPKFEFIVPTKPKVKPPLALTYTNYHWDSGNPGYTFRFEVDLSTSAGANKVVQEVATGYCFIPEAITPGTYSRYRAFFLNGIIGYFDPRATNLKVMIQISGNWYTLLDKPIKQSIYSDFSYIAGENFFPTYPHLSLTDTGRCNQYRVYEFNHGVVQMVLDMEGILINQTPAVENPVVVDTSNVQISEVSNPLVFDVRNYQQVGEEKVLALGTNVDPISSSQFGQYPVYAFTTNGVKALEISPSIPLISRVVPLNDDVILQGSSVKDASQGSLYVTKEGLKILQGRKDSVLSESIEGLQDSLFSDNQVLKYFLNLPQTVNMDGVVDKVPFETYLEGAVFGYSKTSDSTEIYVANSAYNYAYIFDVTTGTWYKLKEKVYHLIDNFPELLAVTDRGLINMSKEISAPVEVYFHTRPLVIGNDEILKKLRRTFLRCRLRTSEGKYAAFYIFSSDDLQNWEFQCGNDMNTGLFKDIWATHSWHSARYYIFVFAAELTPDDNYLRHIEIVSDAKWTGNLR